PPLPARSSDLSLSASRPCSVSLSSPASARYSGVCVGSGVTRTPTPTPAARASTPGTTIQGHRERPRASGSAGSSVVAALMPGWVDSPGTGSGGAAANGACSGGACANGACQGAACWYGSKCSVGGCGLSAAAVAPSGGAYGKG